ncbi:MAG: asparagine synthase (glutamine-hydrolyzing) [Gaiellaceae bacterium]
MGAILDPAGTVGAGAPAAMCAQLRHRGPDGEAVRRLGPATLVHTRLAIVDVAGGDQPLCSEDGSVAVVVNGELYNHLELRSELEARGHRFATRSDCEVVVHLYEEHGLAGMRRLNGIYGLALWDARRQRLVAARDPFGVKPVYWWSDGRRVAVASEVGALLATGVAAAEVDRVALDHYLALRCVPAPRTLFAGISKLAPASLLVAEDGRVRTESFREAPGPALAHATGDELRERFVDAVERQMMSDVPYGAFLSGGVDSAAIVSAMARRSPQPPTTFTIGFPGAGSVVDERAAASETARALGTDHRDTGMEEQGFMAELERCIRAQEEPLAIPSAAALMQLSGFAARSVKVVLSGQGADEPHGGYDRHRAALALGALRRLPGALAHPADRAAAAVPRLERAAQLARLLGGMSDGERLLRLFEATSAEQRAALGDAAGRTSGRGERGPAAEAEADRLALVDEVRADVGDRPLLDQALYLDAHVILPDRLLVCGDKMSMAHSLELRVPYLDVELMRWVERVPARMRTGLRRKKRLHRSAIAPLVPAAALRRARHGFVSPYERWLHTSLAPEVTRRFADDPELGELVSPAAVGGLVDEHLARRADHKRLLYGLLELAVWHRTFIVGAPEREPTPLAAG